MKADTSLLCTFSAFIYCIINPAYASNDERYGVNISDPFKFTSQRSQGSFDGISLQRPQSYMEKVNVRSILSKALSNNLYRQTFLEAMPMLSELTPEQSLGLSELISSRISSKSVNEEEIQKISKIFGRKKSQILKLVDDLATFVRSSAHKLNGLESNGGLLETQSNRRSTQLTSSELKIERGNKGIEEEFIDPRTINEQLLEGFKYQSFETESKDRHKRAVTQLLHKLIRIPPTNSTIEEIPSQKYQSSELKLNTSSFVGPSSVTETSLDNSENSTTLTYEQIEDLAFADLNGTEIELHGNSTDGNEQLPNPEELVGNPRYRISAKHRINYLKGDTKRKRIPVRSHQIKLLQKQCERFTASMCIKADDYPLEQIMGSIRRHKNAMSALLAEYRDKTAELEYQEQLEEYQFNSKRREDGSVITPGGMCASVVRYARPQKARSASGEWKYIVNTGKHTQTLRLEKCSTPQESCSYLSHNYRSRCTQVYNYHRLLSWDKTRGLHVDIFKVPSCCSCQVDGYRETFPPLGGTKHKDYTPVPDNNPYISINDEIDYEDEDDEDPANAYHFGGGYTKNNYQNSELLLESQNIKTKVNHPVHNPTVGSYLSPPSDSYESKTVPKFARPTYYTQSSNSLSGSGRSRKPYKHYIPNESRVDVGVQSTEQSDLEIKTYAINDNSRVHQKRKRLYSGAANAENPFQSSGPVYASSSISSYITSPELTSTTSSHNIDLNANFRNSNNRKEVLNGKRINYNYHPIIDFFESHQKSAKGQHVIRNTATNSIPISSAESSTSRDRRIGFGMEGAESNWHPVVVKS
ncbi:neurotrophin 1 [Episyrphus balteatus]|uniref:neurotrophin 1 n=1 Tax=Episyrphus balteatus TaxID=286459 RepID=UPI00248660E0|nr:neurotrophin 1 [Episyrphus balteatus]